MQRIAYATVHIQQAGTTYYISDAIASDFVVVAARLAHYFGIPGSSSTISIREHINPTPTKVKSPVQKKGKIGKENT